MLGLKLNHISKRGHSVHISWDIPHSENGSDQLLGPVVKVDHACPCRAIMMKDDTRISKITSISLLEISAKMFIDSQKYVVDLNANSSNFNVPNPYLI